MLGVVAKRLKADGKDIARLELVLAESYVLLRHIVVAERYRRSVANSLLHDHGSVLKILHFLHVKQFVHLLTLGQVGEACILLQSWLEHILFEIITAFLNRIF